MRIVSVAGGTSPAMTTTSANQPARAFTAVNSLAQSFNRPSLFV